MSKTFLFCTGIKILVNVGVVFMYNNKKCRKLIPYSKIGLDRTVKNLINLVIY